MGITSLVSAFRRRVTPPPEPLPPPAFNIEAELDVAPPIQGRNESDHWWQTRYGRWRLEAEAAAMRRFPAFRPGVNDDGRLGWAGWLQSALPPGRGYHVGITYPLYFPDEPPIVSILEPELPPEVPHLLMGQRPCLYLGGRYDSYDPSRTTAATLVAWTALWIHAFETWFETGYWPGAEQ